MSLLLNLLILGNQTVANQKGEVDYKTNSSYLSDKDDVFCSVEGQHHGNEIAVSCDVFCKLNPCVKIWQTITFPFRRCAYAS